MIDNILIHIDILWPALLAGLLVLSTHVPLGREVLQRGIIFLDLAIAQIAALGLIIAGGLGLDTHFEQGLFMQNLIAISAAIAGAMLLYYLHQYDAKIQEALIGIMFVLAATGSILLLSKDPHGGERLKELLVGQILWVTPAALAVIFLVYSLVLLVWFTLRQRLGEWVFYPLFAITITLSTQLVGIYLVFSSLIIPALATYRQSNTGNTGLVATYLLGFVAYVVGLIVSAILDFPSGAMIAWSLAIMALLYFLLFRRRENLK